MESKRLELVMFSAFFVGLSILIFFVFKPFLYILILAGVLAVLLHPLNQKLVKLFHGRKSLVACLILVVTVVFLILPILFFGFQILSQAQNFFSLTMAGQGQYIQIIQQHLDTLVHGIFPNFSFSVSNSIQNLLAFISSDLGVLLSGTATLFFETFFLVFTLFFFLRDGDKMLDSFLSLSPFAREQNKQIVGSVERTITSVIRGTIFVAVIRFVLLAFIFYILGVPNALLWGSIGGIIAAIPGLGTLFVIVPAFAYLLIYGSLLSAVLVAIFGIFLVFFIDNLLSTYFFGKGLDTPSIFILFSIIGGIFFFGPLGFIFGPIILSLFISAVDMYKILVLQKITNS